jgi:hypothetical protein
MRGAVFSSSSVQQPREPPMLDDLTTDQVCFIVVEAREFHAKEGVALPDPASDEPDDRAVEILADYADDPSYSQIEGAVTALNVDARAELLALMWLGRGDFGIEEWSSALAQARDYETPIVTAYLMGHPMLADYLEEGLAAHGLSCLGEESGRL